MTGKPLMGWYFSASDRLLLHGDGREIAAGVTHTVDGPPILCERGLHASVDILDALYYATGPVVWRVRLDGEIITGSEKMAATSRTYLWGIDVSDILRDFARRCALDVAHLWDCPDVVTRYLRDGKEADRDKTWGVSWEVSGGDAISAARYAALYATRHTSIGGTWERIGAAAWSAAWSAAWYAAGAAAWDAVGEAVELAAWDAARTAAQSRQSARLAGVIFAARVSQQITEEVVCHGDRSKD